MLLSVPVKLCLVDSHLSAADMLRSLSFSNLCLHCRLSQFALVSAPIVPQDGLPLGTSVLQQPLTSSLDICSLVPRHAHTSKTQSRMQPCILVKEWRIENRKDCGRSYMWLVWILQGILTSDILVFRLCVSFCSTNLFLSVSDVQQLPNKIRTI